VIELSLNVSRKADQCPQCSLWWVQGAEIAFKNSDRGPNSVRICRQCADALVTTGGAQWRATKNPQSGDGGSEQANCIGGRRPNSITREVAALRKEVRMLRRALKISLGALNMSTGPIFAAASSDDSIAELLRLYVWHEPSLKTPTGTN